MLSNERVEISGQLQFNLSPSLFGKKAVEQKIIREQISEREQADVTLVASGQKYGHIFSNLEGTYKVIVGSNEADITNAPLANEYAGQYFKLHTSDDGLYYSGQATIDDVFSRLATLNKMQ